MLKESFVEMVLEKASITDVLEKDGVSFIKKGRSIMACCPYHNERNPSFRVWPQENCFKCYTCGAKGNIITYLKEKKAFSFEDAIEYLADMEGLPVERIDSAEASKIRADRLERETLINAVAAVHKYFRQCYEADSPKAKAARQYAESRWGSSFCDLMEIGYAPVEKGLVEFCAKEGISKEILINLGYIRQNEDNNSEYELLRDRITIPIRSKSKQIIAFTARDTSGSASAKYMNSTESQIFKKSDSMFGIDSACGEAIKEDKMYLVEGAPDVMRLKSLEIYNVVAPLGAIWNEKQLEQIKRTTTRICIIPDADAPKNNTSVESADDKNYEESLADTIDQPGYKAAISTAQLALEIGLRVEIKPLHLDKKGQKQDPDTYFTSKRVFEATPECDFIVWYAEEFLKEDLSLADEVAMTKRVAGMIACIEDKATSELIIQKVSAIKGTKSSWRELINLQRKEAKESEAKKKALNETKIDAEAANSMRNFGFYVKNNCYCSYDIEGKTVKWSNFIMRPYVHVIASNSGVRVFEICNCNGEKKMIELKSEDLVSLSKFRQRCEEQGNFIWQTTEPNLTKLKYYLYANTDTARRIDQLGYQREGVFAFGNGVFDTSWHEADEMGVVRTESGNFYLPAFSKLYKEDLSYYQFERRFVHRNYSAATFEEFSAMFLKVFGNNAMIGIGFLLATLFKDIIIKECDGFPILNVFGVKGSGKTHFANSLMSWFIARHEPPNLDNLTIPALSQEIAQCRNALVHIDEYRNDCNPDKINVLKGVWDGVGRSRLNINRDMKKEMTAVDCGLILTGQQMPTLDIALFSRVIFLEYHRDTFSTEELKQYNKLKAMCASGLSHLTLEILRLRKKVEIGFKDSYKSVSDEVVELLRDEKVGDRIRGNWIIPLAAMKCLRDVVGFPFTYKQMLDFAIEGILRQNSYVNNGSEIAGFWNFVTYQMKAGELIKDADYKLRKTDCIALRDRPKIEFVKPKTVLYLRMEKIIQDYEKHSRGKGESYVPRSTMIHYLKTSPDFFGYTLLRLDVIIRGNQQIKGKADINGGEFIIQKSPQRVMCFDYEMLEKKYGLSVITFDTPISDDGFIDD